MLGIDTILETVCIAKKSIYSEVLTYSGKRPFFLCPKIEGVAMSNESWWRREMNTAVTIAFYRYCRYFMLDPSSCHNAGTVPLRRI